MTDKDLDRLSARSAARAKTWLRQAAAQIDAKIDDAAAHASKAITEGLKRTPDGRATFAAVAKRPSYQAAQNRLVELSQALAGLVSDAREAFYRESFPKMAGFIPAEFHRSSDPEPTQADISAMRGAAIHGIRLETRMAKERQDAGLHLRTVLTRAASRHRPEDDASDLLNAWSARTKERWLRVLALALSDSSVYADAKAGRDVVHEDRLLPHEFVA